MRWLRTIAVAIVVAGLPVRLFAHPAPFTYLDLHVEHDRIEGTLIAHVFDVGHDLNVDPPERLVDPSVAQSRAAEAIALLQPRLSIVADGRTLEGTWSGVETLPERQSLRLHFRYPLTAPAGRLEVNAHFFPYDPIHQTFVNIYEGEALTQAILDDSRVRLEYFSGSRQGTLAVVGRFLPAGITHIVLGPDHLLFLFGLMLLGGTIQQLVIIATAFTLAHALTLTLCLLNLVSPPLRIVEPAIALSIVYVGADNLMVAGQSGGRDVRAWIAAAFGCIHGFGYAGVLRGMTLTSRPLSWAAIAFNVGLEIGQLAFVVIAVWALTMLRTRSEAAGRRIAFVGSIVVIAAGAFWFVQRVFFPAGIS
ncbi:MAG TPA: HupE/UreJ family protein [Vicinamibacterales bacterium]